MANIKKNPLAPKKKKKVPTKECLGCHDEKKLTEFYQASNPLTSTDGKKVNLCKTCYRNMSLNEDGTLNVDGFKQALMLMDKPFLPNLMSDTMGYCKVKTENGEKIDFLSEYMRKIQSLPQYRGIGYNDSLKLGEGAATVEEITAPLSDEEKMRIKKEEMDNTIITFDDEDFGVTPEMLELFGEGYTPKMYRLMAAKYDKLKQNYTMQTSMHEEALATYVRRKVRSEMAEAEGNVVEAEKWGKLAQQSANDGKLTPKQLTKSDLQGGINSFSDIFVAVEENKERIKIFPEFKQQPKDLVDFTVWCYVNYERNLNNLPEVEYKDIYNFYERKKAEYIKNNGGDPYGIFDDDDSQEVQKARATVEGFITIPNEFK